MDPIASYISIGGNRHPAAADWDTSSGLVAYGAERNVATWRPLVLRFSLIPRHGSLIM